MQIGVVTIHYGVNFGSALQVFALCKYLHESGNQVEVINYIPERYRARNRYWSTDARGIGRLKIVMRGIPSFPIRFFNEIIFNKFLLENVPLTKRYFSVDDIVCANLDKDLYITGSDQVWNSDYNKYIDPVYYLGFTSGNKISYAASFGKDKLEDAEYKVIYEYLKLYQGISVREDKALDIIRQCGLKNAIHVLDPVFLLDKDEWSDIVRRAKRKCKYVLVYAMDGKYEKLINIANRIASKKNLKTLLVSYGIKRKANVDIHHFFCNPFRFLRLLLEAEFVVTNSFHGVAFSLNFNKEFIAVKREKYNSRISSILSTFNIDNRMIEEYYEYDELTTINYNEINKKIEQHRNISKEFLKMHIEIIACKDKGKDLVKTQISLRS